MEREAQEQAHALEQEVRALQGKGALGAPVAGDDEQLGELERVALGALAQGEARGPGPARGVLQEPARELLPLLEHEQLGPGLARGGALLERRAHAGTSAPLGAGSASASGLAGSALPAASLRVSRTAARSARTAFP